MIESLVQDRGGQLNTIEVGEQAKETGVPHLKGKGRREETEFSDPVQSHPSEKLFLRQSLARQSNSLSSGKIL